MTSFASVCAIDTGMPLSKPRVTKRCSSYLKRWSSNVNVGPPTPRRIDEVNAVVLEVLQPFNLVPLELHLRSVYTLKALCNAR
jgi:hypothetical protein